MKPTNNNRIEKLISNYNELLEIYHKQRDIYLRCLFVINSNIKFLLDRLFKT